MVIKEEATKIHESGFNCAQSVLCACREYTRLDDERALAISGGFGRGVQCGEICGALTGAVMALGLVYPFNEESDIAAKERIALLTEECIEKFQDEFGCLRCEELKLGEHSCARIIERSAELVEAIILKNKEEK